jgi:hypothetical protein
MSSILAVLFSVYISVAAESVCKPIRSIQDGGAKRLTVNGNVLNDVDSFYVVDDYLFFATGPLYGRPEVGVVDCGSGLRRTIVAAKTISKEYPRGADIFRLKEITRSKGAYLVSYFYSPRVDTVDFKEFENEGNLKKAFFAGIEKIPVEAPIPHTQNRNSLVP